MSINHVVIYKHRRVYNGQINSHRSRQPRLCLYGYNPAGCIQYYLCFTIYVFPINKKKVKKKFYSLSFNYARSFYQRNDVLPGWVYHPLPIIYFNVVNKIIIQQRITDVYSQLIEIFTNTYYNHKFDEIMAQINYSNYTRKFSPDTYYNIFKIFFYGL